MGNLNAFQRQMNFMQKLKIIFLKGTILNYIY